RSCPIERGMHLLQDRRVSSRRPPAEPSFRVRRYPQRSRIMSLGPGIREHAGIYLRGLAMGACDIVPGVSGGTIALITGIYERLVGAIGSVDPASVKHLARGDFGSLRADLEKIDIPFLVVLLAGIG